MQRILPEFPTTPSDLPTELPNLNWAAGVLAAGLLVFHIRMRRDHHRPGIRNESSPGVYRSSRFGVLASRPPGDKPQ